MKKSRLAVWLALAWLVPAGTLLAHHSLVSFDTAKAVRAKGTVVQLTSPDPNAVSLSGRLLNAEVIVMPDGREHSWGDYGAHRCFGPEYRDQHTR